MSTTKVTTGKGYRSEVRMGEHIIIADEPATGGGTDQGPSPYDLLAASLGTCTSMTLRHYANREGYPLDGVEVSVSHERIHAEDCESCESEKGYVHRFRVGLKFEGGDLTGAQRAKLLDIAGRCPVAKTLTREIIVEDFIEP